LFILFLFKKKLKTKAAPQANSRKNESEEKDEEEDEEDEEEEDDEDDEEEDKEDEEEEQELPVLKPQPPVVDKKGAKKVEPIVQEPSPEKAAMRGKRGKKAEI